MLDVSDSAGERLFEFFAATIRNANTRSAYIRGVEHFIGWRGVADLGSLGEIRPLHSAAYIEDCQGLFSAPTVKLRLAGLRSLLDWLVRTWRDGQQYMQRGKTPILAADEAKRLIAAIPAVFSSRCDP